MESGAYELYYNEDIKKTQEANKCNELEKRINKIEETIGTWKESEEFGNVMKALEYLKDMVNQVNPTLAEKRMQKLGNLLSELKIAIEQKAEDKILEFDKGEIEKLYEMSEVALEYYKTLPKVIERLSALKYLHEESAGLMNRIIAIEKAQVTIQSELKETKELMEGVKSGLGTNMTTVQNNLKSLDERLNKLITK